MSEVIRPAPTRKYLEAFAFDAISGEGRVAEMHKIVSVAEKSSGEAMELLVAFMGSVAMAGYEIGYEDGAEAAASTGYKGFEGER